MFTHNGDEPVKDQLTHCLLTINDKGVAVLVYEYIPTGGRNVGQPRKRWPDKDPWRWNKPEKAYTLVLLMMSWPSTPGSLGLHISISNWLFSPVALFRTNRFLRFVLDKFTVSAVWTAHVSVPYSDWQDIREEHRMATDCRNWLPCVLLAYSCVEVLWYTGYFCLFKSRDFQKCRSVLLLPQKWTYFLLCGRTPRRSVSYEWSCFLQTM